jgi:molybdenum cofactor biosynthesis enzyme MoaA
MGRQTENSQHLSKNELKRRAKAEEKERKAAEKADRQRETTQEQAEAEVVCIPPFKQPTHLQNSSRTSLPTSMVHFPCISLKQERDYPELLSNRCPTVSVKQFFSEQGCRLLERKEARSSSISDRGLIQFKRCFKFL